MSAPTKQSSVKHLRIPDPLWNESLEKAADDGLGGAELVRALLRKYLRGEVDV